MSARDEAVEMIRRICPPHLSADGYGQLLGEKFDAARTEVLAEVSTWLVKKAREFRAAGQTVQADTASRLSSKIDRGAVRPNNRRMLPADFFQPGHIYSRAPWTFRCEAISASPGTGERRALGWQHGPVNGVRAWYATALDPDDWAHGGWTESTAGGEES